MIKTYKFKLYTSKRNKKLHQQINAGGLTYNHCIALHKRYYKLYGKSLNKAKLQKHLTKLKKLPKFAYLKKFGSQAVQNITERIEFGYKKFFKKENKRPPTFRKISKAKSFTLKQSGWKLDENTHTIVIKKQKYRYHKSRSIQGNIKTVTIKRDTLGDIYIYITSKTEVNTVIPRLGKSIGFDFGFKDHILIAPTSENDIDTPMFFKRNRNKLKKLQQQLARKLIANTSRCVKNKPIYIKPLNQCKNIQKSIQQINKLHKKIKNQRADFHWKLAQALCGKYALICLETLNMKWMQKHHGKKVMDYGFSDFITILKYTAQKYGTTIIQIDKWYPSSQICSKCGYQNKEIKNLKIREWICPECHTIHDRDRNASKNILKQGLLKFATM